MELTFVSSLLIKIQKRVIANVKGEINEMIIECNHPDDEPQTDNADVSVGNKGNHTARHYMRIVGYRIPTGQQFANEAREDLETIINMICYEQNKPNFVQTAGTKDDIV